MRKRFLSILLCLVMVAGMLPTVAFAEGTGNKNIMLGTSGIKDPTKTDVEGKGSYYTLNSYIYFGVNSENSNTPIKWRVLDADNANDGKTNGIFLLSEYLLASGIKFNEQLSDGNSWQGSKAQSWCKTYAENTSNFSEAEQSAMLGIAKTDSAETLFNISWSESSLTEQEKLFLLSVRELADYVGTYNKAPGLVATDTAQNTDHWWLRSHYSKSGTNYVGGLDFWGNMGGLWVTDSSGARPAFNLNPDSILFTSAAEGGKSATEMESGLTAVGNYDGSEWKLTLLDSSRNFSVTSGTTVAAEQGETVEIAYSGAETGENEYVSAMITDSSENVLYYGRIAQNSASGTASVTIPSDLAVGEYTLKVFSEQYNGDKMTDYASDMVEASLHVHDWSEPTYTWAEDGKTCTATRVCQYNASHIETETVTVKSEVTKPATCTEGGKTTYTATFTKDWATTQTKVKDIDSLGHDFTGDYDAYDEDGHWHICNRTDCTVTETKQKHSFTSYTYNNDATYFADGTETAICDAAGCLQTHTRTAKGTKLVDSIAPTGEIKVKENTWKSFINTITFGIFCKDKYDVTITATDAETGVASVEYLLSDTAISETDIANQTGWQTYAAFSLESEGKYIVYAKITDNAGNVTYISSDGLVIDKTAPVIGGLVDGKTYCETVTFTVDDEYIDYVTVNGEKVTDYTLAADGTTYTVKAYDKAGNESLTYTVTVNDGHTFTNYTSDGNATCTQDGTKTAKCDFCDVTSTITDTGSAFGHDWDTVSYTWAEDGKTCTAKRICKNDASHTETATATVTSDVTKPATCTEVGETTYSATFTEDWATTQTKVVADIAATDHSWDETTYEWDTEKHWLECECGAKKDENAHTYGEWTVTKEATETEEGEKEHTCTVCGYTEKAEIAKLPATDPTEPTYSNPDTGDSSNLFLWIALLFVGGFGVIGTGVYCKRRRSSRTK